MVPQAEGQNVWKTSAAWAPGDTSDTGDTTDTLFWGARFGIVRGEIGRRLKLGPQPPVGRHKRAHASREIEKGTGRATAVYWMGSSVTRAASGCSGRITFCDVVVRFRDDVTTSSGRVNW